MKRLQSTFRASWRVIDLSRPRMFAIYSTNRLVTYNRTGCFAVCQTGSAPNVKTMKSGTSFSGANDDAAQEKRTVLQSTRLATLQMARGGLWSGSSAACHDGSWHDPRYI